MPQYDSTGQLTDHGLLVATMLADMMAQYEDNRAEMTELSALVADRFGPDALENSASYFTGWHYSPTDILNTAIFEPEWLARLMRNGSRDCCASVVGDEHRAHCGHAGTSLPTHGTRVRHDVTGDLGTVVGASDGDVIGIVWDDSPELVDHVIATNVTAAP